MILGNYVSNLDVVQSIQKWNMFNMVELLCQSNILKILLYLGLPFLLLHVLSPFENIAPISLPGMKWYSNSPTLILKLDLKKRSIFTKWNRQLLL